MLFNNIWILGKVVFKTPRYWQHTNNFYHIGLISSHLPVKFQGEDEQEKFLKITEAYETLKDPDKRNNYDLYGSFSYSKKYDYRSQSEYDNLFYNGLYHNDPFVDTLSGATWSKCYL